MRFTFLYILMTLTVPAFACPLGKGEEKLTVQRVMRNFGRFTVKADTNALRGINPFDKVTVAEIHQTLADLDLAISCAQAVLSAPRDLLPTCTQSLSGKSYDDYVNLYINLMRDFEIGLVTYRRQFQDLLYMSESTRSFESAYKQSKNLEKLVDTAHKALFGN